MTRKSVKTYPYWVILTYLSFWLLGTDLSGQSCLVDFVGVDTVTFEIELGACEVSDEDILERLGLGDCPDASLTVSGVGLNTIRPVELWDESLGVLVDAFMVKVNAQLDFIDRPLVIDISISDCSANKERILNELNVINDVGIRSTIHFIDGTSRLTTFPIGDTVYIDKVVCGDGYTYAENVKVLFKTVKPALKNFTFSYEIGFTTRDVSIEEILSALVSNEGFGYDCGIDRYTIDNSGPYNYGLTTIGDIYLDNAQIADNLRIEVVGGSCPTSLLNMPLDDNQCYINKADILDTLGFNNAIDDYSKVDLVLRTGQSLEDESFIIDQIRVNGFPICNNAIPVSYVRPSAAGQESNLACNGELNISLDDECQVHLNSDVLLQNGNYCYLNYIVTAEDEAGAIVAQDHNIVLTEPGTYKVSITNPRDGVKCWSTVRIEDKHIYDVTCPADTLSCVLNIKPSTDPSRPQFPEVGTPSEYSLTTVPRTYNITNDDVCGIKTATYTDIIVDQCRDEFKEVINRVWTFHDSAGNQDTCHQYLYITKPSIDSVDLFVPFKANCISDFALLDDNGHPSPEETGYPTINGGAYNAGVCGTLKMTYSDNLFDLCGNSIKIIREWIIIDWCTDKVDHRNQTILIEDKLAPEITSQLPDIYLDSHPFICGAENIVLPQPTYSDCGSEVVDIEVLYENFTADRVRTVVSNGSNFLIPSWEMQDIEGQFEVYYVLTDECGNVGRDTIEIFVTDNQPPVAVCDQVTSISIAGNGEAQVKALTFDDLSVDNCGIAKYEARKLDGSCYMDNEFKELLVFCCDEVGTTLRVEFRVTDLAGNYNTCMVFVDVFDKFTPIISCPANITIDCSDDYIDTDITGMAQAIDNCVVDSLYFIDDVNLDECGKGFVERQWIAKDKNGQTATCDQRITIISTTPFTMTHDKYPRDTTINGCLETITPDFTGRPNLSDSTCSQILTTYEDTYFTEASGACFKIVRDWIVIDWCQYSTDTPGIGRWMKSQAIKVINTEAPTFVDTPTDTILCSYGADCSDLITISAAAIDDCTAEEDMDWFYELYYDPNNPNAIRTGARSSVSAQLAEGDYQVRFTVSDGCGNYSSQLINITVQDCVAPVIDCPSTVAAAIIDDSGLAVLELADIAKSASDNCTNSEDLVYSYSRDSVLTELTFTCLDIPDGVVQDTIINLYVFDDNGNVGSCEFALQLSDNGRNICDDIAPPPPVEEDTLTAAGLILTEERAAVDLVKVKLTGPNGQTKTLTTSRDGSFGFKDLAPNSDYAISFERDGDAAEGMTTLDLIFIQRHILGLGVLDSPYKVIAADIDNSRSISGSDLAKMRRILLGIEIDFDNDQKVWRFVQSKYNFESLYRPFPFPESIAINDINKDEMDLNMMAVKIGDVNGSNEVSSRLKSNGRSHMSISWEVMEPTEDANDPRQMMWPVYGRDLKALLGFQLALQFESNEVLGLVSGQIDITSEDYHVDQQGLLKMSWLTLGEEAIIVDEGMPLFYIITKGNKLDEGYIQNDELPGLVITEDLEEVSLSIVLKKSSDLFEILSDVQLSQNTPNPFREDTRFVLTVPKEQKVNIAVYTIDGRLIYSDNQWYPQGTHNIRFNTNSLHNYRGVMMVHVTNGTTQLVRKMVRVD